MDASSKKNRLLIIGAITLIVVACVAVIIYGMKQRGKIPITLRISPTDSVILVGDKPKKHSNGSTVLLYPGEYTFTGKREDFNDASVTQFVDRDNGVVVIILEPSNENGELVLENNEEQLYRESLYGQQSVIQSTVYVKSNPIVDKLPYVSARFSIDYGVSKRNPNDPNAMALYVTAIGDESRFMANSWLKANGVDLQKDEIIYSDQPQE